MRIEESSSLAFFLMYLLLHPTFHKAEGGAHRILKNSPIQTMTIPREHSANNLILSCKKCVHIRANIHPFKTFCCIRNCTTGSRAGPTMKPQAAISEGGRRPNSVHLFVFTDPPSPIPWIEKRRGQPSRRVQKKRTVGSSSRGSYTDTSPGSMTWSAGHKSCPITYSFLGHSSPALAFQKLLQLLPMLNIIMYF